MRISKTKRWVVLSILVLGLGGSAGAVEVKLQEEPKLVLVLSGGGARGVAHIGVLKVLEELQVVPDMIVGTSIGSIVGGLYAAGWSPEEIEEFVLEIDWSEVFTDRIDRDDLSFRRKQDDRPYLIPSRVHFDDDGFYLPSGMLGGQGLELLLRSMEARTRTPSDFDDLPIPYRAVATDVETGDLVVLDSGSLATAMRSSMAIPGMFTPVELNGHKLIDGGSIANLPVGVAQSEGAESIIAIDISSPLTSPDKKLSSFLNIFFQLNSILTVSNRVEDKQRLKPGDVYIRPDLEGFGFLDFDNLRQGIAIGAKAARAKADELKEFSVSDQQWSAFLARHRSHPADVIHVDRVRLENHTPLEDRIAAHAIDLETPADLDPGTLRQHIMNLFHLRSSGVVSYRVEELNGQSELVIIAPPPDPGPNTVQLGLSFFNDFRGDTGYGISARHQLLPANRLGGEWQNILQLGSTSLISTEFYQPLGEGLKWFMNASTGYHREEQKFWHDGTPRSEYAVQRWLTSFDGGRVLGNWGVIRAGAFFADNRGKNRVGNPNFPDFHEKRGGFRLSFAVDTVNSVVFPRSGAEVIARYDRMSESLGSDLDYEAVFGSASYAWSIGELTIRPAVEYGKNLDPTTGLSDLFYLGGLGRLSGLGTNELFGNQMALARLQVYHRLSHLDISAVRISLYVGASLEAGNVFTYDESPSYNEMLNSWAAYIGAETPLGPLYLAYGHTEGGNDRFYFAIGDHF